MSSLKRLLADTDATVRHKTTEVLYIISGHASGRDAFLEHEIITPLSNLVGQQSHFYKFYLMTELWGHQQTREKLLEVYMIPF